MQVALSVANQPYFIVEADLAKIFNQRMIKKWPNSRRKVLHRLSIRQTSGYFDLHISLNSKRDRHIWLLRRVESPYKAQIVLRLGHERIRGRFQSVVNNTNNV